MGTALFRTGSTRRAPSDMLTFIPSIPRPPAVKRIGDVMKLLALLNMAEGAYVQDILEHRHEHLHAIWALYSQGFIREMYARNDKFGAVYVLEANSREDAMDMLGKLPLVKTGQVEVECMRLEPFTVLETLFAKQEVAEGGRP